MRARRLGGTLAVAVLTVVMLGLTTSPPVGASARNERRTPRIVVPHRAVLVDQPIRIRVEGVAPGAPVDVRLTLATSATGSAQLWTSHAVFMADRHGRVDPAEDAPVAGDYGGVDPMGLFWSAHATGMTAPPQPVPWTETVHLTAAVGGATVAAADVTRYLLRPGGRSTLVRDRGLVGTFFEPGTRGRHPAVIVVSGSEGGNATSEPVAALLASHGYDALALAYFGLPGLPPDLSLIPLEYFSTAIDWLGDQPSVDPHRLAVSGASRGAELALLLGSRDPRLRAVVAIAPSSVVWAGTTSNPAHSAVLFESAWTEHGQPVPFLEYDFTKPVGFASFQGALADPAAVARAAIPVERIHGPVLLLNGADDALWPSPEMAAAVMARLAARDHDYRDQHVTYPGTGHIIPLPNEPTTAAVGPHIGGTPEAVAHAARDAWPRLLQFLQRRLGGLPAGFGGAGRD